MISDDTDNEQDIEEGYHINSEHDTQCQEEGK